MLNFNPHLQSYYLHLETFSSPVRLREKEEIPAEGSVSADDHYFYIIMWYFKRNSYMRIKNKQCFLKRWFRADRMGQSYSVSPKQQIRFSFVFDEWPAIIVLLIFLCKTQYITENVAPRFLCKQKNKCTLVFSILGERLKLFSQMTFFSTKSHNSSKTVLKSFKMMASV